MSNALISVIIPVYNARPYLADAVRSVCRCDYEELEIILVDDGSTDGSGRICDTFAGFDSRVKVIHKERGGVSSARNAGLEIASGEWIAFCDADDKIESGMYTYLVKKAKKHNADIVQCGIYFDTEDSSKPTYTPPCDIVLRAGSKLLEQRFIDLFAYGCHSKIFRRDLIAELRFDERWAVGEDLRFGLDALSRSQRIVFAPRPMYRYIQRDGSIMHTADRETLTAFDSMIKSAEEDFKKTKVLGRVSKRIKFLNYTDMCSKTVLSDIPEGDAVFDAVRKEVIRGVPYALFASRLPKKEKRKLVAIAIVPKLYKKLLTDLKPTDETEKTAEAPTNEPIAAPEALPEIAETVETAEAATEAAETAKTKSEIAEEAIPEAVETVEETAEDIPVLNETVSESAPEPVGEPAETIPAAASEEDGAAKTVADALGIETVQKAALGALGEVKRICDAHGIKYYLTAGTLLGAVRHGGFIPWDDDIDVLIPRADFKKFVRAAKSELAEGYFYQDGSTEKNYPFGFSKIRAEGINAVEDGLGALGIRGGAYADIFPLDKCPVKDSRAERYFKLTRFIETALIAKGDADFVSGYEKRSALLAFKVARNAPRAILKAFRTLVRAYYTLTSKGERLATVEGSHGYPRETYEKEWFKKRAIAEFEGDKYRVPSGWQELLTNMYGDFMTPPEESERRGHITK